MDERPAGPRARAAWIVGLGRAGTAGLGAGRAPAVVGTPSLTGSPQFAHLGTIMGWVGTALSLVALAVLVGMLLIVGALSGA